jgi:urease accessory protein UreF
MQHPLSNHSSVIDPDSRIVSISTGTSLEEMAQGLDWARWLLSSVRQRSEGIVLPCQSSATTLTLVWQNFCQHLFVPQLGEKLLEAWHAAAERDLEALIVADHDFGEVLDEQQAQRSIRAGALLLRRTSGARYQGMLGQLRRAVEEGRCQGHIGAVWPAVAVLFQITPAATLAEYLRLEWETCTRGLRAVPDPVGACSFQQIVQRSMRSFHAVQCETAGSKAGPLPLPHA